MKPRHSKWDILAILLLTFIVLGFGLYLLLTDQVVGGTHPKTLQPTGASWHYFIVMGLILLGVCYFSLSPFHPLREFIEKFFRKKK